MSDLQKRTGDIARAPVLLVGCDFDGTVSPIVDDPASARADPAAIEAMLAISKLPDTHVAVISGRSLADLRRMVGDQPGFHLVGGHGGEFARRDMQLSVRPEAVALLDRLDSEVRRIAAATPGTVVERKTTSIAFHYRRAATEDAMRALEQLQSGASAWPGVFVRRGKMVIELGVDDSSKGKALRTLCRELGATHTVFIGDDETDEDAFLAMSPGDMAVKVGPGSTAAPYRVGSIHEVIGLLRYIGELRSTELLIRAAVPIDRHAVLSDQRTIALATPAGRLSWLCIPRIDSGAMFADLLGGEAAGYFDITCPDHPGPPVQAYEADTFVLRTRWGELSVVDYFDCSSGRPFQRAGRTDLIRVLEGKGRARAVFAPRVDFGRVAMRLTPLPGGLEIESGADPIVLYAPDVQWTLQDDGRHQTAVAEIDVKPGRPVIFELRGGTRNLKPPILPESERRAQTLRFWSTWAATLRLPPLQAELVKRSALVLKALSYGPTGAIAAAATTSLPENIGGVRNWDYRFCWPRDAALSAAALVRLGNTGQAMRLLDWMLAVLSTCESPDRLRPIYTVAGTELGAEAEIGELRGYAGSRPVRIGNAAAQQVQLDVFGPITDLVALMGARGAPLTPEHWRLVQAMAAAVEARWEEPDHGIWEFRGPRQHHVYTKVMCWQTMDRAITIADQHLGRVPPSWIDLRDRIAAEILERGFDESLGAFTMGYGDHEPDAASLHVGLSGLLPPADPRFTATIDLVERRLRDGPTVYRYTCDDGLPGREGGFHICMGWLIESLALTGRIREAEALFDELCGLAGPLGLISEQYDPATGRSLGNYPQAYSHLAVINAAVRLASLRGQGGSGA